MQMLAIYIMSFGPQTCHQGGQMGLYVVVHMLSKTSVNVIPAIEYRWRWPFMESNHEASEIFFMH